MSPKDTKGTHKNHPISRQQVSIGSHLTMLWLAPCGAVLGKASMNSSQLEKERFFKWRLNILRLTAVILGWKKRKAKQKALTENMINTMPRPKWTEEWPGKSIHSATRCVFDGLLFVPGGWSRQESVVSLPGEALVHYSDVQIQTKL